MKIFPNCVGDLCAKLVKRVGNKIVCGIIIFGHLEYHFYSFVLIYFKIVFITIEYIIHYCLCKALRPANNQH